MVDLLLKHPWGCVQSDVRSLNFKFSDLHEKWEKCFWVVLKHLERPNHSSPLIDPAIQSYGPLFFQKMAKLPGNNT